MWIKIKTNMTHNIVYFVWIDVTLNLHRPTDNVLFSNMLYCGLTLTNFNWVYQYCYWSHVIQYLKMFRHLFEWPVNKVEYDDHHWRRQRDHLPVPAVVCGTPKGKRGLLSKHVHYQLARCNKLLYYLLHPKSTSLGIKYQGIKIRKLQIISVFNKNDFC